MSPPSGNLRSDPAAGSFCCWTGFCAGAQHTAVTVLPPPAARAPFPLGTGAPLELRIPHFHPPPMPPAMPLPPSCMPLPMPIPPCAHVCPSSSRPGPLLCSLRHTPRPSPAVPSAPLRHVPLRTTPNARPWRRRPGMANRKRNIANQNRPWKPLRMECAFV